MLYLELPFPMLPLKILSDVPARVIFAGIICLSLWKVEYVTVEAHQPFLEALRAVSVVGYQYLQLVGKG